MQYMSIASMIYDKFLYVSFVLADWEEFQKIYWLKSLQITWLNERKKERKNK